MNSHFKKSLLKNIQVFKKDYLEYSRDQYTHGGKMLHAGEFGVFREKVCKELFQKFVSSHIEIAPGFVINSRSDTSSQQDLIFYDKTSTPILKFDDKEQFVPIETIACVGQVKSVVRSMSELQEILLKLVEVKKMRHMIDSPSRVKGHYARLNYQFPYDPIMQMYDQIFTFLVCEDLNFTFPTPEEIDSLYPSDLDPSFKHNLILVVNKGLFSYRREQRFIFSYPKAKDGEIIPSCFVPMDAEDKHVVHVLNNLFIATTGITILHVDLGPYLS